MASETDKLGSTTLVPSSELNYYHRNPRKGDVEAIMSSLVTNGQYTPIIVNIGTLTGRPNEVLAGNHTLKAFRKLAEANPFERNAPWQNIKVHWVDVSDERAERLVVTDNQTFELGGGTDPAILSELLQLAGVEGTGYTEEDLDKIDAALAAAAANSDSEDDPPKPSLPAKESAIGYTIVFDTIEQQEAWFEFVKWLKETYDDPELTVAERLMNHIEDTESERV